MKKLIKINDEHYVVVDDSEIKENDWIYDLEENVIYLIKKEMLGVFLLSCRKITHSTQPLEQKTNSHSQGFNMKAMSSDVELIFDKIKQLSLSEVQETIKGYSVEKMAIEKYPNDWNTSKDFEDPLLVVSCSRTAYRKGFIAHETLVKDKIQKDFMKYVSYRNLEDDEYIRPIIEDFLQFISSQNEWEIKEITSEGRIILNN